jgi:TetR/AcrR family transcriptional regulator of autoinduction and epiphytic fitness
MEGIADHFWGIGPGHVRSMLTTYFVLQTSRGTLALDDPEDAAHQFLGMLLGNFHLQCLLNLRPSPNHDEIDTIVRTAVPRFLDGCRARA